MQDLNKPWYEVWPERATPTNRVRQTLSNIDKLEVSKYRLKQISPNLEILGEYVKLTEKISVRCSICGWLWEPRLGHLFKGFGCPSCSGLVKLTNEHFIKLLPDNVIPLDTYDGMRAALNFKCKDCQHIWNTIPRCVIHGRTGCPHCANQTYSAVYLLYLPSENLYKIGITKTLQTIPSRAKQIHKDILVIDCWHIGDKTARKLEYKLHNSFKEKRTISIQAKAGNTEFFKLDNTDIIKLTQIIEEYINDRI